jgi:hypothetical protein
MCLIRCYYATCIHASSQVTAKKTEVIMSNVSLNSLLVPLEGDPPPSAGQGEVLSQHYYLLPADLRDTKGIEGALARAGTHPIRVI